MSKLILAVFPLLVVGCAAEADEPQSPAPITVETDRIEPRAGCSCSHISCCEVPSELKPYPGGGELKPFPR